MFRRLIKKISGWLFALAALAAALALLFMTLSKPEVVKIELEFDRFVSVWDKWKKSGIRDYSFDYCGPETGGRTCEITVRDGAAVSAKIAGGGDAMKNFAVPPSVDGIFLSIERLYGNGFYLKYSAGGTLERITIRYAQAAPLPETITYHYSYPVFRNLKYAVEARLSGLRPKR